MTERKKINRIAVRLSRYFLPRKINIFHFHAAFAFQFIPSLRVIIITIIGVHVSVEGLHVGRNDKSILERTHFTTINGTEKNL